MRRRGGGSVYANPVLVGAVTTLVVIIAVFLAYNANNGLPFVPSRQLDVLLPNGANLVKGNEVREGGFRVGVVTQMVPARLPGGKIGARMTLKLDEKVGAIPVDTRVVIRPRSALGLKYVELKTGRERRTIPEGGTLGVKNTRIPVELDELYNTFDKPTRQASAENLDEFGDAFAFRGTDLNRLIAVAPKLFGALRPVAANLVDPRTELDQFFVALNRAASQLAPVSRTQARLFTTMADTFGALVADPKALRDTIAKGPATADVAVASFRAQRPFLRDTVAFSKDLSAAAADLPHTLPTINDALRIGTPIVRRSTALSDRTGQALDALNSLASEPSTNAALRGLTETVETLQPQLRFLGPYITICNSWNFFWTLAAEHLSAPSPTGTTQRAMLNMAGQQSDSIGAQGATRPAAGLGVLSGVPQYLHDNFYSHAVAPNGQADCEAGQQGYIAGANPFTTLKDERYKRVVLDPTHTSSIEGPTYRQLDANGRGVGLNIDHLPAGQTSTVEPGGLGATLDRP